MKKTISIVLTTVLLLACLASTAMAITERASYQGSVWTGKPTVLGTGYYCTAARNDSQGDETTHWAWARTYYSGTSSYQKKTGNVRAVASSGQVHPTSGEGEYGETGWSCGVCKFKSSAWD